MKNSFVNFINYYFLDTITFYFIFLILSTSYGFNELSQLLLNLKKLQLKNSIQN